MRLQHIIVATDFSHRAARAVSRAGMLASEHRATLNLVHVTTALPPGEIEQICGKTPEELQREDLADIHRSMAQQLPRRFVSGFGWTQNQYWRLVSRTRKFLA
jgi:nucleotide-binding universal stress UspA family protein